MTFDKGSAVQIEFQNMNLDSNCDQEFIEIRNGGEASSPLLGRYCGKKVPSITISESNRLWIDFHSSIATNRTNPGFKLKLEAVAVGKFSQTPPRTSRVPTLDQKQY